MLEQEHLLDKARGDCLHEKSTTSSYHIAKIAFAETAKRFVDLYNSEDVGYDTILLLERETIKCYESLPDYLRQDRRNKVGQQLRWQQLFMGITLHNRIMRLHRPFLTCGYTNPEYKYSVKATLTSAKSLIGLVTEGKKMSFPGLRWWVVLVHIFTAGVALCIDLHYHLGNKQIEANDDGNDKEEWVREAIRCLDDVRLFSKAANRAVEILETLYRQVQVRSTQNTPQETIPESQQGQAPDWTRLFEQALESGEADYTTDQAILETINTFALGVWPS